MPQRAFNLALAIVGVIFLAVLIIVGIDWARAARTGPSWRRRLLCAAIALLSALGFAPPIMAQAQDKPITTAPAGTTNDLAKTKEWDAIIKAWEFVTPLAQNGKSTTAQRKEVQTHVDAAIQAADRLAKAGLLDASEAKLLNVEIARMMGNVERNIINCSPTMVVFPPSPARNSLTMVQTRLQSLQKLAASGKVHPQAIRKVLPDIEADLNTLADEKALKRLSEKERQEAAKVSKQAREAIEAIKQLLLVKPTTMPTSTTAPIECYEIQYLPKPTKEQQRTQLDARRELLANPAVTDKLRPEVLTKAKATVEDDLRV